MGNERKRLAILIDADNIGCKHFPWILKRVEKYGDATVKRIYGNFASPHLGNWHKTINAYALKPIQLNVYSKRKNSTDIGLIIDAMDLYYTGKLDGFCIVTSDSDYTGLCVNLKEKGMVVYGFGYPETATSFRNACNEFFVLSKNGNNSDENESLREGEKQCENCLLWRRLCSWLHRLWQKKGTPSS